MTAKQKLRQARLQEWTLRFNDQKSSGLTARQWCEQNSLSFHAYNYWKHQLKETVVDQMLPEIVPIQSPAVVPASDTFVSDSVRANRANCAIHANQAPVKITVNDITVELDPSVPETFLITLLKAVRHA